jgi:hypothetical protein
MYENIIDEALFISRASEGAVSTEWIMNEPIFIRKKYAELLHNELEERARKMKSKTK